MSSMYGENLRLSVFGQSHAPAIGMTLDGIPAGLPVDMAALQAFLARRAPGQWSTIAIKGKDDILAKVTETFAKNKANHKLEFWSSRDLQVQDDCTFFVYGDLLESYISYKRKDSTDDRWYYKSGELAVTAAEKLRRDR